MAEPPRTTSAFLERIHHIELRLNYWNDHELRDALSRLDTKRLSTPIPAGNQKLSLIIRVDQTDQIAEHDTVLVAEARTRKDDGGEPGVLQIDGQTGRNQLTFPRLQL